MYIDYNKIMGKNYNLYVTEEKLAEIKELAKKERVFFSNKYHVDNITTILSQKSYEIAYVNGRNSDLNDIEKTLLASNVVFDDEKFVSIIKKGNFDVACLETFITLVHYIKNKIDNNKLSKADERYIKTVDIYTNKLVNHFAKYVGIVDNNIIINKLNEILSFNPELLDNNNKKYIR